MQSTGHMTAPQNHFFKTRSFLIYRIFRGDFSLQETRVLLDYSYRRYLKVAYNKTKYSFSDFFEEKERIFLYHTANIFYRKAFREKLLEKLRAEDELKFFLDVYYKKEEDRTPHEKVYLRFFIPNKKSITAFEVKFKKEIEGYLKKKSNKSFGLMEEKYRSIMKESFYIQAALLQKMLGIIDDVDSEGLTSNHHFRALLLMIRLTQNFQANSSNLIFSKNNKFRKHNITYILKKFNISFKKEDITQLKELGIIEDYYKGLFLIERKYIYIQSEERYPMEYHRAIKKHISEREIFNDYKDNKLSIMDDSWEMGLLKDLVPSSKKQLDKEGKEHDYR